MLNDNYSSILQYYESLIQRPIDDYAQRRYRLRLPVIPEGILQEILVKAIGFFRDEPSLLLLEGDFVIIGDLYGSILDLLRIFKLLGFGSSKKFLFLGNLIGDSHFSLEVMSLVFLLKNMYPEQFFIIRGSNEFQGIVNHSEFQKSINDLYTADSLYFKFLELFSYLPFAAVVNNEAFCVHSGFGPSIESLSVIKNIKRPFTKLSAELAPLFWSNPTDSLPLYLPTSQGILYGSQALSEFLEENELKVMIRGHMLIPDGIKIGLKDKLNTVFSCSNYNGSLNRSGLLRYSNKGAELSSFDPLATLCRTDVAFLRSQSETVFSINQHVSSITSQRSILGLKQALPPTLPSLADARISLTTTLLQETKKNIPIIGRKSVRPIVPNLPKPKHRRSDMRPAYIYTED